MDCTCRLPIVGIISGFPLICDIGSAHHTQKLIRDDRYRVPEFLTQVQPLI